MRHPNSVVTRFAPSPTGFLHIGNARTALFNWLYARHMGGRFLLRIEDTDRARSTEPAIQAIFDGLTWLGLDWDGEAVFQSHHLERHAAVAHELLAAGRAYHCYMTPEELEAARDAARASGQPLRSPWRDRPAAEAPAGAAPVLRFKAPREGETLIPDGVQGDVRIPNSQLDDMVLLRSDGTPTYMLSVVVDDHDMGVTDVIRGDDHLTNAARQIQLFNALGWTPPAYAHIALIHGPDGAKLSKRHGALGVDWYRDAGYLPEAMRNYLARLGWSHGDAEIFSTDEAIQWFDVGGLNKSAARLDFDKLDHVNAVYIRSLSIDDLIMRLDSFRQAAGRAPFRPVEVERLTVGLAAFRDRAKTLKELDETIASLCADGWIAPVDDAARKVLGGESAQYLSSVTALFMNTPQWDEATLSEYLKEWLSDQGLKMGEIGPVIRVALTGQTKAPSIFTLLVALGREEALKRLHDAGQALSRGLIHRTS